LGSDELLFQVTSDGLLLLPSEGGGVLVCLCLVKGLACGSDESLLLSVHSSGEGWSHDHDVILLPLGGGRCCGGGLLPIHGGEVGVAARYSRQVGGG
jgi:hypothetical protein